MNKRSVRDLAADFGEGDVLLTTREAAALCRRSEYTLQGWRRQGIGPEWEVFNTRVLYRLKKVRAYLRLDDATSGKAA
jgi:hypothetical protein